MDLIICTECGLEIPEKVFRDGRSHLKRRYCFEAGERIRARLAATERELDEFRRLLMVAIEKRDLHAERISDLEGSSMKVEKQSAHYKEILMLAAPILDAVDDAAKRVRFTELHGIS